MSTTNHHEGDSMTTPQTSTDLGTTSKRHIMRAWNTAVFVTGQQA